MAVVAPEHRQKVTEQGGQQPPDAEGLFSSIDAVASFVSTYDPARYSGEDAARLVKAFTRVERLGAAGKTLSATRVAECHPHLRSGHRTPAEWLSAETGDSVGESIGILRLGETLTSQPEVNEALRGGMLSPARAALVSDAVTVNPGKEDELVNGASTDTFSQLRQRCLRAKAEGRSRADEERHRRAIHRKRRCRTFTDSDGAFRLDALLTPEAGASLLSALQIQADRIFEQCRKSGTFEPSEAYRADALLALVTGQGILRPNRRATGAEDCRTEGAEDCATEGDAPADRGPASKPTVHVRVDLDALRRGAVSDGELCEIPGVGPVPVEWARQLLGTALCELVITNGVDVTTIYRMGRHIPARLYSALMERDPMCVVPGCDTRLGLENDHWLTSFSDGGMVSMENIARLCNRHHRLRTHHGFQLLGGPGKWRWVAPESPRRPERRRPKGRSKAPPAHDTEPPLFTPEE